LPVAQVAVVLKLPSFPVFLIGGAGPPAPLEFALLIEALGPGREIVPADMVVFHGGVPAPDFSMVTETDALLVSFDAVGAGQGHLVGYSGGAAVALAFACAHPERVASLTLEEPAWVGTEGATDIERRFWDELGAAMGLELNEALLAFRDLMVQPAVRPTLPSIPKDAPWIEAMVRGVRASIGAFAGAEVDWPTLARERFPIWTVVGSLSNPAFQVRSERLIEHLPRASLKVFEGSHHVIPPHRMAAPELAAGLEAMWARVEVGD
jgi:pimeloyl-ACP methyl ester carboxylesterase